MFSIERNILINLPVYIAWEKLRDLTLAENYIPDVYKIKIVSDIQEGLGAHRKAYLSSSDKIVDEHVIDWVDGSGFTLKLTVNGERVIAWYNEFFFQYNLENSKENTLCRLTIHYEPRIKGFFFLQSLVHNFALGRHLKTISIAMKDYYETSGAN